MTLSQGSTKLLQHVPGVLPGVGVRVVLENEYDDDSKLIDPLSAMPAEEKRRVAPTARLTRTGGRRPNVQAE